jgi:hypothetical protein
MRGLASRCSEQGKAAIALDDTLFYADRLVEISGLGPERDCFRGIAGITFENGQTPDCVCQFKRCCLLVVAIEAESLVVAGLGQGRVARRPVDVSDVPNRVSESGGALVRAIDNGSFFVGPQSGVEMTEVSLDLPRAVRACAKSAGSEDWRQRSTAAMRSRLASSGRRSRRAWRASSTRVSEFSGIAFTPIPTGHFTSIWWSGVRLISFLRFSFLPFLQRF